MNKRTPEQEEVIGEALEILEKYMAPSKLALLISMLPWDGGDSVAMREELFAGETVDSLVEKIQVYQKSNLSRV